MSRRLINFAGIAGNGSDGTLSIILPIGLKYYNIYLELVSGTCSAAQLTNYKVIANNQTIQENSATIRDYWNVADGLSAYSSNSILRLPQEMPNMIDAVTRLSTALNTGSVSKTTGKVINNLRLEWTVSGASSAVWKVSAEVDDASPEGPGAVLRSKTFTDDVIDGEQGTTKLPYGTDQWRMLRRVGIDLSSGAVESFRVLFGADNKEIYNCTKTLNDQILTDGVITPGSSFEFIWDLTGQGLPEMLDTAPLNAGDQNLQILPTCSASATATYCVESIGGL